MMAQDSAREKYPNEILFTGIGLPYDRILTGSVGAGCAIVVSTPMPDEPQALWPVAAFTRATRYLADWKSFSLIIAPTFPLSAEFEPETGRFEKTAIILGAEAGFEFPRNML
ncbi:MAG: hypothetical protein NT080_09525 [Spirochaetes bacterium]|nr:hypothetical protein [Spirochaetota bacterium]